jgi:hypothetical protein
MARKRYKAEEIVAKLRQTPTRNMPSNPVSIQHQRHARLLSKDTLQAAGTHRTSGRHPSSVSHFDVRRRRRITARSSILIKSVHSG